ncbi:hypothetical protein BLNAU_18367 [Blattamonas nauphoetae]|uniref:Protein kinase domain-containing protein n=1 Tax=Blattamonas nauphoetae TaxID=2049346 RepID=A0ABQ9X4T3_9EUKA|nr:hypothetical protein BLNAU_18367 [Blattamonas nauphoetae]
MPTEYDEPTKELCKKEDTFQAAVLFYECLFNSHPFHGKSLRELRRSEFQVTFCPRQDLPPEVNNLLSTLLTVRHSQRPSAKDALELPIIQEYRRSEAVRYGIRRDDLDSMIGRDLSSNHRPQTTRPLPDSPYAGQDRRHPHNSRHHQKEDFFPQTPARESCLICEKDFDADKLPEHLLSHCEFDDTTGMVKCCICKHNVLGIIMLNHLSVHIRLEKENISRSRDRGNAQSTGEEQKKIDDEWELNEEKERKEREKYLEQARNRYQMQNYTKFDTSSSLQNHPHTPPKEQQVIQQRQEPQPQFPINDFGDSDKDKSRRKAIIDLESESDSNKGENDEKRTKRHKHRSKTDKKQDLKRQAGFNLDSDDDSSDFIQRSSREEKGRKKGRSNDESEERHKQHKMKGFDLLSDSDADNQVCCRDKADREWTQQKEREQREESRRRKEKMEKESKKMVYTVERYGGEATISHHHTLSILTLSSPPLISPILLPPTSLPHPILLLSPPLSSGVWRIEFRVNTLTEKVGVGVGVPCDEVDERECWGKGESSCFFSLNTGTCHLSSRTTKGNSPSRPSDIITAELDFTPSLPTLKFQINHETQPVFFVGVPQGVVFEIFVETGRTEVEILSFTRKRAGMSGKCENERPVQWS